LFGDAQPAFARSPALKNGVSLPSEDLCATLFHTDQNQIIPANPGVFIPSTQITYRIHRPYLDQGKETILLNAKAFNT